MQASAGATRAVNASVYNGAARMKRFEIRAMTFGPYGLGHLDGKTVMAPNVAPGDLVETTITGEHRDYALAGPPRVIHPGRDRREPPCIYLPRCGGCDWQQISYAAQLRLKAVFNCVFHQRLHYHRGEGNIVQRFGHIDIDV